MNKKLLIGFLAFIAMIAAVTKPNAQSKPIAFVPTGTGFFRAVSGVETPTAQKVPLGDGTYVSGIVGVANGGTGLSSPGTAGNVLISNGSAWTSGAVGWTTAFDCDFTAVASTNPLCGTAAWCTTVSMCGQSWTVKNPGSSRGNIRTLSGSGLVLETNTGGTQFLSEGGASAAASGPQVWLPLSALSISNVGYDTKFRVWLDVGSQSLNASSGSFGLSFGLMNNLGANPLDFNPPAGMYGFLTYRSHTNATTPQLVTRFRSGTSNAGSTYTTLTGFSSWTTGNATTIIETGPVIGGASAGAYPVGYIGTAYTGGSWATVLAPVNVNTSGGTAVQGDLDQGVGFLGGSTNYFTAPVAITSRLGILIAMWNTGGFADPQSITVKRVRLDYRL